ncbi:sensor histidine kinase [Paenibacillus swuensis]|uniref:sensor histidine kinase n=1 Tax=Paenibacillus swuensis TaxID=1178515 RepID=UPI0012F7C3C3|nr:histidine kinase [Paenibacillus swuensis]
MKRKRFKIPVPYTLRNRMMIMQITAILVPVLLIGSMSYVAIYHILENKIQRGVELNLKQVRSKLETTLDNMNYVTKQQALDERTVNLLQAYRNADKYDRYLIKREFDSRMLLMKNTNPDIGMLFFYFPGEEGVLFENPTVRLERDPRTFPLLSQHEAQGYNVYGPHESMDGNPGLVISFLRKVQPDNPGLHQGYFYLETKFPLSESLIHHQQYGMAVKHVLANQAGKIVFTERPEAYPQGNQLIDAVKKHYDKDHRMYLFHETSSQGWTITASVSRSELRGEIYSWLTNFTIILVFSVLLGFFLARQTWRMIVDKLGSFKKEIEQVANGSFQEPPQMLDVMEFDDLILKFDHMRERLLHLMEVVAEKEKNKRDLEVEKLKYQINPHFIHNTLNTIQWIARLNKQHEIDHLIAVFTRLLHYNLGKEGEMIRLREEIQAITDYVELQRIRYQFHFQVLFEIPEEAADIYIPGFLLQPLVENSMYHGFTQSDGSITIEVSRQAEEWIVEVRDNGQGISEEDIARLFVDEPSRRKSGLGIGLSFVDRTLKNRYGDTYGLQVSSTVGEGTTMRIRIPVFPVQELGGEKS